MSNAVNISEMTLDQLKKGLYVYHLSGYIPEAELEHDYEDLEADLRFLTICFPEVIDEVDLDSVELPDIKPKRKQSRRKNNPLCSACGKSQLKGEKSKQRGMCSYCYYKSPEGKKDTLMRVRKSRDKKREEKAS